MSDIVLVTGGLGYVGGRASKYLADNTDYKLRIITRQNEAQVPEWLRNGEIIKADLMSGKDIKTACAGVRYIVHLAALNEIERVGKQKYIVVESYRNVAELFNLQCWALTCEAFYKPREWTWLFREFGYTGDYEFIYFE